MYWSVKRRYISLPVNCNLAYWARGAWPSILAPEHRVSSVCVTYWPSTTLHRYYLLGCYVTFLRHLIASTSTVVSDLRLYCHLTPYARWPLLSLQLLIIEDNIDYHKCRLRRSAVQPSAVRCLSPLRPALCCVASVRSAAAAADPSNTKDTLASVSQIESQHHLV